MIIKEHLTGWTPYQLSDIYTERREPGNDTLPMLTVSIHDGVSDGELDDDELGKKVRRIADKTQYRVAKPGDLVFNMMRAWQGAIGVARSEGMVSPAYIVAKPNDKVYPLFMDYYMKTPRMVGIINRQSYGVTDFRKRLYWDSFAPINVMLPPIAEQKKIAAILTTQDKVIELKERRLAEKQRQKKYLMQQLLTGKKRLDGFTDLWLTKKMQDVMSIVSQRETIPNALYVSTENMLSENAGIDWSTVSYDRDGIVFQPEDILYGNIRPYLKKTWKADCVGTCSADVLVFRPQGITPSFLYQVIMSDSFTDTVMHGAKGSKMPRGDKHHIMNTTILLPSIAEQTAIINFLSLYDNELALLQKDLDQEKQKKKALMQLLLTGKVRVKND